MEREKILAEAEAGYTPNTLQGRVDDDEALRRYAAETQRLGHPPTHAELRLVRQTDKTVPSSGVYERLGPKGELLAKVAGYCQGRRELADVPPILAPLIAAVRGAEPSKDAPDDDAAEGVPASELLRGIG